MTAGPRIAIDAMGGDTGPAAMIAGASRALRQRSLAAIHLSSATSALVDAGARSTSNLRAQVTVVHSPDAIAADRKAEPGDPPRAHHLDGHGDQRGQGAAWPTRLCRPATPAR